MIGYAEEMRCEDKNGLENERRALGVDGSII
jgi:hypothetical protein